MKDNKEAIFDWVIDYEDQCLANLRVQLLNEAQKEFGDAGRQVVEKYYRQIDGEEPLEEGFQEDCNDCREKAKRLLEVVDFLKTCNEALTSEVVNDITKDINKKCWDVGTITQDVEIAVHNLKKKTLFEIDNRTEALLKIRVLLEIARRYDKQ